eukprot:5602869-Amphidinium_carterae.1
MLQAAAQLRLSKLGRGVGSRVAVHLPDAGAEQDSLESVDALLQMHGTRFRYFSTLAKIANALRLKA